MKKIISIAIAAIILASCSTSNDVVSNKLFQKRKYQKGWHVNSSKKIDKSTKVDESEAVAGLNQEEKENPSSVSVNENTTVPVAPVKNVTPETEKTQEVITIESTKSIEEVNSTNESVELVNIIEENTDLNEVEEKQIVNIFEEKAPAGGGDSGINAILLIVLCIFLSPLAVGLMRGWDSTEFIISIILWLLFVLPGIIYALLIFLDVL